MIGYRDMTFCPFYEDCKKGEECARALNDEVKEGARQWMGENAPIVQFVDKPYCWEME